MLSYLGPDLPTRMRIFDDSCQYFVDLPKSSRKVVFVFFLFFRDRLFCKEPERVAFEFI